MDESVTDEVRRQSILKSRPRFPLQEVPNLFGDDDTVTTTLTHNRRVSFGRKVIKEFLVGSAVSTQAVHEYEQSSESVSDPSDCSGPLDLALNKSCRDIGTEIEPSEPVITPPESFSDNKSRNPEQRARIFTENCINIAKSVFQDTETELTAIIIGAKPTLSEDDRKNSSCMSFTTMEMSQDFVPMRHSEILAHPESNHAIDKGRFDFLDQSLGNVTLGAGVKPNRQYPRTPLAHLPQVPSWESENDENIPPAHNSYRNTTAFKPNTSEVTMDFTYGNIRPSRVQSFANQTAVSYGDAMEETCNNLTVDKSIFVNNEWKNVEDEDDPLRLDATRDDFLSDLSGLEGKTSLSDESDSSPFKNIQEQLANLSSVNQSFRERVQTLNVSTVTALGSSPVDSPLTGDLADNELSFLQTPAGKNKTRLNNDSMEMTEAVIVATEEEDPLAFTPVKGNISLFDESVDVTDKGFQPNNTHVFRKTENITVDKTSVMDFTQCPHVSVEGTEVPDLTMELTQISEESEKKNAGISMGVDNDVSMEFTQCRKSTLAEESTPEESKCDDVALEVENDVTMEFTQCRKSTIAEESTPEESKCDNVALEVENDVTMEFTQCRKSTIAEESTPEESKCDDVALEVENDVTMEFTQCRKSTIAEESTPEKSKCDNVALEVENDVTMEFTQCRKSTIAEESTPEESKCDNVALEVENDVTMEFTQCRKSTIAEESTPEKSKCDDVALEYKDDIVETPCVTKSTDLTMEIENDVSMEFTECRKSIITEKLTPKIRDAMLENSPLPMLTQNDVTIEFTQTCRIPEAPAILEKSLKNSVPVEMTEIQGKSLTEHVENMELTQQAASENIDDTLPVEPDDIQNGDITSNETFSVPLPLTDVKDETENVTQLNTTASRTPPLETPLTGLAALSTRPSLQAQLQSAAPDSTTTSVFNEHSEVIEDALRSIEITESSIGGVLPKPMKTMSEEQHMCAIHESTRVIDDATKVLGQDTYTLKLPNNTYSIDQHGSRLLNLSSVSPKPTPDPGEPSKGNRISQSPLVNESFGKRTHSESPLPDQSLLKKNRVCVARTLNLTDDSFFAAEKLSPGFDVSITLHDITLSQTEKSAHQNSCSLEVSLPDPEELLETSEIAAAALPPFSLKNPGTPQIPSISLLESQQLVSSTTHNDSENFKNHMSKETNDRIVIKTQTTLEQQSEENSCVWKMLNFDPAEGFIQIEFPLLATGLILNISFSDVNITNLSTQHRPAGCYQRAIKAQINEYGYETLRRYIAKEEQKIRTLDDITCSLDYFNSFTIKLSGLMKDALTVLHGCAGSELTDDHLSIRVYSFPTLISCWVDLNLNDILFLGQPGLRFRHETGRLDEQAVRALLTDVKQPLLQNFVRTAVFYITEEEQKLGLVTKRPSLLF